MTKNRKANGFIFVAQLVAGHAAKCMFALEFETARVWWHACATRQDSTGNQEITFCSILDQAKQTENPGM